MGAIRWWGRTRRSRSQFQSGSAHSINRAGVTSIEVSGRSIDKSRQFTDTGSVLLTHLTTNEPQIVTQRPLFARRREGASNMRPRNLLFLAALAIAPGLAWPQSDQPGRPSNSHSRSSASGWECDRGYTVVDGSCVAIPLPAHAFLDTFGDGWECLRGYHEVEGGCDVVPVPPNGRLDFTGHRWECARGYQKVDQECVAIRLPPNAYLSSTGSGWECDRGYREVKKGCEKVEVPANGFLDSSGRGWDCDRGYARVGASCAGVVTPANAYLDGSGGRSNVTEDSSKRVTPACPSTCRRKLSRAFRERLGMQLRLSENRRILCPDRRARERLPQTVGRRMGLRSRLQEARRFVCGFRGPVERPRELFWKRLGLRFGLPTLWNGLHGERAVTRGLVRFAA